MGRWVEHEDTVHELYWTSTTPSYLYLDFAEEWEWNRTWDYKHLRYDPEKRRWCCWIK